MKYITLIFLILISRLSGFSQSQFIFSGKITGAPNTYIKIDYINSDGKRTIDSCLILNDIFSFKGYIGEPTRAGLSLNKTSTIIFLESGNITAYGSYDNLKDLKITGSKTQDEYQSLQVKLDEINKEFAPIGEKFLEYAEVRKNSRSKKVLDSINEKMDSLAKEREPFAARYERIIHQFVTTCPDSYVSPFEMIVYAISWQLDSVKNIYNSFSPPVRNSFYGRSIKKTIDKRDKELSEKIAKNFTAADINGKSISLSDFKGKYVLLDFWGSWCVPCRESTPHLIELFKKYNKSGLEIIAVAANDTPDNWKRAIQKDKTKIWHNVLDDKNVNNTATSITAKYAISVFPTKILIGKNGTIIARYTGTEEAEALDKKLAEIFKE